MRIFFPFFLRNKYVIYKSKSRKRYNSTDLVIHPLLERQKVSVWNNMDGQMWVSVENSLWKKKRETNKVLNMATATNNIDIEWWNAEDWSGRRFGKKKKKMNTQSLNNSMAVYLDASFILDILQHKKKLFSLLQVCFTYSHLR